MNMLSSNGAAIQTLRLAFYGDKQLMLLFTHRRCIKKIIMSGHDLEKLDKRPHSP